MKNSVWLFAGLLGIFFSTGNTSASAAAYAAHANMVPAVLIPQGKIAMGKLAQAVAHGSKILQVDGNFDDCLDLAKELSEKYPVALVNSVNPYRIEGQKTAAFEIVDLLVAAPHRLGLLGVAGGEAVHHLAQERDRVIGQRRQFRRRKIRRCSRFRSGRPTNCCCRSWKCCRCSCWRITSR